MKKFLSALFVSFGLQAATNVTAPLMTFESVDTDFFDTNGFTLRPQPNFLRFTNATTGALLYIDANGGLGILPFDTDGKALKGAGGLPAWGTDLVGTNEGASNIVYINGVEIVGANFTNASGYTITVTDTNFSITLHTNLLELVTNKFYYQVSSATLSNIIANGAILASLTNGNVTNWDKLSTNLVGSGGSGNGFPLTNNANAGGYGISNLNYTYLTNKIILTNAGNTAQIIIDDGVSSVGQKAIQFDSDGTAGLFKLSGVVALVGNEVYIGPVSGGFGLTADVDGFTTGGAGRMNYAYITNQLYAMSNAIVSNLFVQMDATISNRLSVLGLLTAPTGQFTRLEAEEAYFEGTNENKLSIPLSITDASFNHGLTFGAVWGFTNDVAAESNAWEYIIPNAYQISVRYGVAGNDTAGNDLSHEGLYHFKKENLGNVEFVRSNLFGITNTFTTNFMPRINAGLDGVYMSVWAPSGLGMGSRGWVAYTTNEWIGAGAVYTPDVYLDLNSGSLPTGYFQSHTNATVVSSDQIEGTHSIKFISTSAGTRYMYSDGANALADSDEKYWAGLMYLSDTTPPNEQTWIVFVNSGFSQRAGIRINTSGQILGINTGGSSTATLATTLAGSSASNPVAVCMRAKKGTGANAEIEIWASNSVAAGWGSSVTTTDGTWTDQVAEWGITTAANNNDVYLIADMIFVDSDEMPPITEFAGELAP